MRALGIWSVGLVAAIHFAESAAQGYAWFWMPAAVCAIYVAYDAAGHD